MEKKISKLQKKSNLIFALFQKMIDRLLHHNAKLKKIHEEATEEIERLQAVTKNAGTLINDNLEQVKKLNSFIGKEDNSEK